MTEEQIERAVERKVDALDHQYTTTGMTEGDYRKKMAEIDTWAAKQRTGRAFGLPA